MKAFFKLVVVGGLAASLWLVYALGDPKSPGGQTFVSLKPGSSTRAIANELARAGVIHSSGAFLVLHAFAGRRMLKAGEYAFDRPANAFEIYDRLERGDVYRKTVVVPEGFNMFDVALALEAAKLCTREEFLAAARSDAALVSDLDPQARSLEGYLFPDTYSFGRNQKPHDLAAAMVKRFRKEAAALGLKPGDDVHRIVTLASIVEKETAAPSERPLVASVFVNRLKVGMGLATDPSVIYAALLAGRYNGVIHQSDLAFDSPYNTYRYAGLPPGPIANPGRASLDAAMHPARSDYLYFVANNQGGHNFARTLDEHNHNVVIYRQGMGPGKR